MLLKTVLTENIKTLKRCENKSENKSEIKQ